MAIKSERDRAVILARRARFVAAALAGVGLGAGCGGSPGGAVQRTASPRAAPPPSRGETVDSGSEQARPDRDQDGLLDEKDLCPDYAEDRDGVGDDDGCPEMDHDNDKIPDVDDECPNQVGPRAARTGRNGCPQICLSIASPVDSLDGTRIEFASGSAELGPAEFAELDRIAADLVENSKRWIVRLWLVGESAPGEPRKLALQRAKAVDFYLESRGIDPEWITPVAADRKPGAGSGRLVVFASDPPKRR